MASSEPDELRIDPDTYVYDSKILDEARNASFDSKTHESDENSRSCIDDGVVAIITRETRRVGDVVDRPRTVISPGCNHKSVGICERSHRDSSIRPLSA